MDVQKKQPLHGGTEEAATTWRYRRSSHYIEVQKKQPLHGGTEEAATTLRYRRSSHYME
ncbi:hypothetical protein BgiMline_024106, partial [Biomphalaria glabrata]